MDNDDDGGGDKVQAGKDKEMTGKEVKSGIDNKAAGFVDSESRQKVTEWTDSPLSQKRTNNET